MTNQLYDHSFRNAAIVAGFAILIMTVAAVFATDLTIGRLIIENDGLATFYNIQSSELLFRAGILSWLIILICDVLAAWGLYIFLKPVDKGLSLLMAWFRLVYAAILGTALYNYVEVLLFISKDSYMAEFNTDQLQRMVMNSIDGFQHMWALGLIIFSIHIYFLGYIIIKSGYVPKLLGIFLLAGFIGYLVTNILDLLCPACEHVKAMIEWIFLIPMLSEVYLGFWLLIKGVKVKQID